MVKMYVLSALLSLTALVGFAEQTVVNASFQEIADGRAKGWSLQGHFRAEAGAGHNGSGGLIWKASSPSLKQEGATQRIQLKKGVSYRFVAQAQTEGFAGRADICIEWFGKKGWIGGAYLGQHSIRTGSRDWAAYESNTAPIPEEVEYCQLQIFVTKESSGIVRFDNVAVLPRELKPVSFVSTSAYRGEAESGEVRFHASLRPPKDEKGLRAVFRYRDAQGCVRRVKPSAVGPDSAQLKVDVKDLAYGSQDVVCALETMDGRSLGEAAAPFTRVEALRQRKVAIDRLGRCLVGGKPFFPIGLYTSRFTEEAAKDLSSGPFNCAIAYGTTGKTELDVAERYGLKLGADIRGLDPDSERWRRDIDAVKNHPALFVWYVNDEAPLADLSALRRRYDYLSQADADHPVYAVMDRTYDLRDFQLTYDVLGVDPYPVESLPLSSVSEMAQAASGANLGDRPFWNVPQAFAWSDYRNEKRGRRFPTEAELRSMCWQHIACGANGLIGYCQYGVAKLRKDNPAEAEKRWRTICRVFGEVKAASDVLLTDETAPKLGDVPSGVVARAWRKDGKVWLLVCNLTGGQIDGAVQVDGRRVAVSLSGFGVFWECVNTGGATRSAVNEVTRSGCADNGEGEGRLLRFGFMTDTHVSPKPASFRKLRLALELFKAKGCELIVNGGDISDHFYPTAYAAYRKLTEETFADVPPAQRPAELFAYAWHDAYDYQGHPRDAVAADSIAAFKEVKVHLGATNDPTDMQTFGGIPFLVFPQFVGYLKNGYYGSDEYERRVAEACAANPGKPVFVVDHIPAYGTVCGSWGWEAGRLRALEKHPQVVHLSGHVHGDIANGLFFWQGGFTEINGGDLYPTSDSWGVVTVDVFKDRIEARRWDIRTGEEMPSDPLWRVDLPYRPSVARRFDHETFGALRWDSGCIGRTLSIAPGKPTTFELPCDLFAATEGTSFRVVLEAQSQTVSKDAGIFTLALSGRAAEADERPVCSCLSLSGDSGEREYVFSFARKLKGKQPWHPSLDFSFKAKWKPTTLTIRRIRVYARPAEKSKN